jgi:23S rRNA (guanosine2251-2'-O)-methyltransferase
MRKILNAELGRLDKTSFQNIKKRNAVIVLDNIRSAMNIGAVFRTSDAFAIDAIYLCGISAQPPHREIQKTALGATESVSWKYFATTREAIIELKNNDFTICGIEQLEGGIMLQDFNVEHDKKYAFIFGNEVNGISDDILNLLDIGIEIPQFGTKHSFNISVTAGIVLWDFYSKTLVKKK